MCARVSRAARLRACRRCRRRLPRFLLDAGADPSVRNAAGERPGDKFDSVFVPEGEEAGGEGGGGDEEGPREAIKRMLEAARDSSDAERRARVG